MHVIFVVEKDHSRYSATLKKKGKLRMKLNEMKHEGEEEIVAKALDGQRYLLPLCEYM